MKLTIDIEMPSECHGCIFEDNYGGCKVLNLMKLNVSYLEFDEEWFAAHKAHRRLKFCPLSSSEELNK